MMNAHDSPRPPARPESRPDGPWTIGRLLTWTTDYLKRRGSESPRLDAEVMLAHVLDWQRVQLYTHFEEEVSERARAVFASWSVVAPRVRPSRISSAARNSTRSLLTVSPAVLIPRPESEFVVVEFLTLAKGSGSLRAVDVGTGSGCLAIASAHRSPEVRFVAIDISDGSTGSRPAQRREARRDGPHRFSTRRLPRAGRRRGALRRDHLQSSLHRQRGDITARARSPRLRAADGPGRRPRRTADGHTAHRAVRASPQARRTSHPRDRNRSGEAPSAP